MPQPSSLWANSPWLAMPCAPPFQGSQKMLRAVLGGSPLLHGMQSLRYSLSGHVGVRQRASTYTFFGARTMSQSIMDPDQS